MLAGASAPGDTAFEAFVRSGAAIEMKSVTGMTDAAGGYAVPREIDAVIDFDAEDDQPDP